MVIASLYPCPFDLQFRHDFSASPVILLFSKNNFFLAKE